ncbi:MATE family efflux transporter [Methylovirgula sp. 4M-Z18]|uniref:MATE family efflux transporter n=1 Tax=Methylovirgula sp. 4M-Z18 TaxID=2293567 RepID=UPI000E2FBC19|nr:MATE family efflux transporter [Methylovirgula sp. 4M-Z18]RFB78846.1 MATE family efflux transporter [Methylovirgula sp. 4M-Z18]
MTDAAAPGRQPYAVFTEGKIIRHVAVMTATGSIGLMAIFAVDLLSLWYLSHLDHHDTIIAGVGFAYQVLFFTTSIGIGLTIAVTATCAKTIGAGRRADARRLAASGLTHMVLISTLVVVAILPFREPILTLLGARDETLAIAKNFLAITLPANVIMAVGMGLSGVLRAVGDARRAMYVTLAGGLVTVFTDPLFIFVFGFGVYGAAIATVISRCVFVCIGTWGVIRIHNMLARPNLRALIADWPIIMAIAVPAVLTNLATPVANAFITRTMAHFGEEAIAATAIIDRLVPVAFGVVFALSGAVGSILGQNLGAKLIKRVKRTLTDSLLLCGIYVILTWALLALFAKQIPGVFYAKGLTAHYVEFFCTWGVSAWFFVSGLFVANACFNNLGFPVLSTVFNWTRATLGTIPFVWIGTAYYGVEGGQIGIAIGAAIFGTLSILTSYFVVDRLAAKQQAV